MTDAAFPRGFVWGAGASAYQVEGAAGEDGRGPSIWDTFSHVPGRTFHGDTGDVATDQYHRLDGDLELMRQLGLGGYRFSVAWSRVQPDGRGRPEQRGLDFYRRQVDGLRERGILPVPTLCHFDLPQAMQDLGGWPSRDVAERFAEYAGLVAGALGADAGPWVTLNEPWCSAWLGYGAGLHAPGVADVGQAVAAGHHLLLAHGLGVQAIRAVGGSAHIGIALNLAPVRAATDGDEDRAAALLVDGNRNRLWLDALFRGRYPDDMLAHYAPCRPGFDVVRPGDLDVISTPIDLVGQNYYSPVRVAAAPAGEASQDLFGHLGAADASRQDAPVTAIGWEVDPEGLTEVLTRVAREYSPLPQYVMENGAAYHDYLDPEGRVKDPERIAYLDGHVRAARAAIEAGVDLRGYFVWALTDNFEWAEGYFHRFGLTFVEYASQRRVPKSSFEWYRGVIAANGIPRLD